MEIFSALLAICAGSSPVPVNSPHKGQLRGALMFSLISAWINGWVNNLKAGDLRRNPTHYDVIVMNSIIPIIFMTCDTDFTRFSIHLGDIMSSCIELDSNKNISLSLEWIINLSSFKMKGSSSGNHFIPHCNWYWFSWYGTLWKICQWFSFVVFRVSASVYVCKTDLWLMKTVIRFVCNMLSILMAPESLLLYPNIHPNTDSVNSITLVMLYASQRGIVIHDPKALNYLHRL